jgi:hypothetical protein
MGLRCMELRKCFFSTERFFLKKTRAYERGDRVPLHYWYSNKGGRFGNAGKEEKCSDPYSLSRTTGR